MKNTFVLFSLSFLILGGCHTVVYDGKTSQAILNPPDGSVRIFLPPVNNATDDEHAGRAITELTATALLERHIPLIQSEPLLVKTRVETSAGPEGLYSEAAAAANATHLLVGTVHEYRYKTDLDGDPAVAVTLRLVDAKTGLTVWQGSTAAVHAFFASLSTTGQYAIRSLVGRIPATLKDLQKPGLALKEVKTSELQPSSTHRADRGERNP